MSKSRLALLVRTAREQNLTLRELYLTVACASGHWIVRGTAQHIADTIVWALDQPASVDINTVLLRPIGQAN